MNNLINHNNILMDDMDQHINYNTHDYQQNNISIVNNESDFEVKNNYIVVNSKDRNWLGSNDESPYKFSIKFGGSNTDKYSVTSNEYKNISYIEVSKLFLNDRANLNNSNVTTTKLSSLPYIQCKFKNFSRLVDGTNSVFDSSMGIFVSSTIPITTDEHQFVNFDNQLPSGRFFQPIPLNTLTMIDIELLDPQGNQIKNKKDVLDIKSIHINNETSITKNDYLIITTTQYFDNTEFKIGDTIQCKNYSFHNTDYDETFQFNQYINSLDCHTILGIGKSNDATELYNRIHIQFPSQISRTTGNLVVDTWFSSFLIKSLDTTPVDSNQGRLINLSTQTHLLLQIDTMHKTIKKKNYELI